MERLWAPWRLEYIKSAQEEEQECIFCHKPGRAEDKKDLIVHRAAQCFVMLNKYPYINGHIMVVPYQHESDILKLSDEILLDMHHLLQLSVQVLQNTMKPHGINIGINIGRSAGAGIVDHLHYHIVPRWMGDTNFMPILAGTKVVSEGLDESWETLQAEFKKRSPGK
jgi:ATP adenylyltransferase